MKLVSRTHWDTTLCRAEVGEANGSRHWLKWAEELATFTSWSMSVRTVADSTEANSEEDNGG